MLMFVFRESPCMAVIFRILRTRSHLFTREIFTYPKIAASQRTKVSNSFTESMNDNLPVHDALKPLSWLEGKWTVETPGQGKYPTIESFTYCEKLSFTSIGQPMLNYEAQSWHPIKKNPMHREVGFLRMMPGSENKVVLLLSHNFGLQTIEEGTINDKEIKLESISITRMSEGTKEPSVAKIQREFKLVGDCLEQVVYMATSTTSQVTEHLRARYIREREEA